VRKRLGHDAAAGLSLKPVVADRRRSLKAFLDITVLEMAASTG
jgi:hypothetical protein